MGTTGQRLPSSRVELIAFTVEHIPTTVDEAAFIEALPGALAEGIPKCHKIFASSEPPDSPLCPPEFFAPLLCWQGRGCAS